MPSRAKRAVTTGKLGYVRILEPEPRVKKNCAICEKPMLVAPGQIAKYHKKCRKLRHNKNAHNN